LSRRETRHIRGRRAEQRALRFLRDYGLKYLGGNFRTPVGEIDLILQDGKTIVFVEIRSRSSDKYMDAVESIDHRKVSRIINAGRWYLQYHGLYESALCRFDVVTLTGKSDSGKIEWIKNAFEA